MPGQGGYSSDETPKDAGSRVVVGSGVGIGVVVVVVVVMVGRGVVVTVVVLGIVVVTCFVVGALVEEALVVFVLSPGLRRWLRQQRPFRGQKARLSTSSHRNEKKVATHVPLHLRWSGTARVAGPSELAAGTESSATEETCLSTSLAVSGEGGIVAPCGDD